MRKFWPILFFLLAAAGAMALVLAAWYPEYGFWLPKNISQRGQQVDQLFQTILFIVGGFFILINLLLVVFLWRFAGQGRRAFYTHGSMPAEVVWTLVPGAFLAFLAFNQWNLWQTMQISKQAGDDVYHVELLAGQFEWRFRYPGEDLRLQTQDDVIAINQLHLPANHNIEIAMHSRDVIHSFFVPSLRLKQDVLPGMRIPIQFRAEQMGTFELVCAELCGWGHYTMRGQVIVESREDYQSWLQQQAIWQEQAE